MIGSPDVLALTETAGFSEGEDRDRPGLPDEHAVPLLARSQPWSSSAQFRRDFILVAEFSEQVGPTPVLTVPDDPELVGAFDLNHFSVRMMSVDYQASGPGHAPPAPPGPRLHFSEDSEVILGDSGRDAFAYVRHLTLHDLEARGLVRPFCMAYVSSDQTKLTENFCELSAGFSRAAEILKTGNRQTFSAELQTKLRQLQFARASLQAAPLPAEEDGLQLEAVERSISTHQELLRQVTSYPNRKLQQPDFLPYDLADTPPEETPPPGRSSEPRLKSLDQLCNGYFLSLMRGQLADTERRLRGDRTALHAARVTRWLSRKLPLTNFLFELWRPEDEDESEDARAGAGPDGGEDPSGPDAFSSCVEELAIKLEPAAASTPDLCGQMTGSVSSGDSIEVLGTERSFRAQRVDADGRGTPARGEPPRPARRANSEDSIEVLSTTESICPEDLAAITEGDEDGGPEAGQVCDETQRVRLQSHQRADGGQEEAAPLEPKWTAKEEPAQGPPVSRLSPDGAAAGRAGPRAPPLFAGAPVEPDQWTLPPPPAQPQSADDASDCTGSDPSTSGAGSGRRRRRKAGLRALRFLKENSFSQHAVFCLLSGRALVVLGADQARVRKLLDALRLFLPAPGPDGSAVMTSLDAPLQLSDLLTRRLIGVHRLTSGSSSSLLASLTRLGRYLALLDLDQGTLRCPSYAGSLVGRLADPRTSIRRGATYLLHLESGLTALSNQALLHAFARRHGDQGPGRRSGFCGSDADQSVIRFLSELIALRHAGAGPPVLRVAYVPVTPHKNSHPT
ncbi:LOW QUALITY PROTEIN: guanine nucleotide exchange protein smcr8b [Neosynchiropus ocellatus]